MSNIRYWLYCTLGLNIVLFHKKGENKIIDRENNIDFRDAKKS